MIIAGIVIVVVALVIGAVGVLGGGDGDATLNLGVGHVTMSPSAVFLLGALAMLLLAIGFGVIRAGLHRVRQHHQDRRRVDKLSRELDQARRETGLDEPKPQATTEQDDRPTPI